MCGRYALGDPSLLKRRFGLEEFAETDVKPRFNVAPSQDIPIVVQQTDGKRELRMARWGFVPFFMEGRKAAPDADGKKMSTRPPPINARAETIETSGMFRNAVKSERCIIPADGFFEWQGIQGEKTKQPMHIRLKDQEMFGFAGLYTTPSKEKPGGTAVIITTTPNELLVPIHNRMPVILLPALEDVWLDPTMTDVSEALTMLMPYPADAMGAYAVSPAVNGFSGQGPELILPV